MKKDNLMNEKCCNSMKCKCNNKIFLKVIVLGTIIVCTFLLGLGIGGYVLVKDRVSTDENNIGNDHGVIVDKNIFNENSDEYKDISLKNEEDIEIFINSMNYFANEELRDAFFDNRDDNVLYLYEFMASYVLLSYFDSPYYEPIFMEESFIVNEMNKVFDYNNEFVPFFSARVGGNSVGVICVDGLCAVGYVTGGGTGYPYYKTEIIDSRQEVGNTIYTLEDTYYERDLDAEEKDDSDKFIYTSEKGSTYEMTFDKDNRYVSSKKIK